MARRSSAPLKESEAGFQWWVIEYAVLNGWDWGHIGVGRVGPEDRYVTPVDGPLGVGHADLLLARERVVYAECKSEGGRLKKAQVQWLRTMRRAGAEVYVWKPSDRPEVERVLR